MENTNTKLQVAQTIQQQIGHKAFVMLGAKNLLGDKDSLSFRIGKNAKGVNYVKVTLNALDLYDVEFGNVRGLNYTVKHTATMVPVEALHSTIEAHTAMFLSL